mmetsp:Transcript_13463/g.50428  ORF Transcript_13463/g.50428 Transcript_13463/m.50428 type:complete len:214 (-) Transcript_13463:184-825(-)
MAVPDRHALVRRVLREQKRGSGVTRRYVHAPLFRPAIFRDSVERFVLPRRAFEKFPQTRVGRRREQSGSPALPALVQIQKHAVQAAVVHVNHRCAVRVRRKVASGFVLVEQQVRVYSARGPGTVQAGFVEFVPSHDCNLGGDQGFHALPQRFRHRLAGDFHGIRIPERRGRRGGVPERVLGVVRAPAQGVALFVGQNVGQNAGIQSRELAFGG